MATRVQDLNFSPYFGDEQIAPLVEHGRRNIETGGAFTDDRGYHTILSGSVQDERLNEGRPTVIPFVYEGREVGVDEAIDRAVSSGTRWPSADTEDQATQISMAASDRMNEFVPPPVTDNDFTPYEDTWGQLGRKLAERAPTLFKMSAGGLAQAFAESAPVPPTGISPDDPQWQAMIAGPYQDLFRQAREAGTLPGQQMVAEAVRDLQENEPEYGDDKIKEYGFQIAEAVVQMVPMIATAIVTRGATASTVGAEAAGLSFMGVQVYGQQYGQSRSEGRTPDQATADATFVAAAETIPEMIPLGLMMKPGGTFLGRMLRVAGAEGLQEMFTEVLEAGYDAGVLDKDMTWGETVKRVIDAGIVGAGAGAILGGGAHEAAPPLAQREEGEPEKPEPPPPRQRLDVRERQRPEEEPRPASEIPEEERYVEIPEAPGLPARVETPEIREHRREAATAEEFPLSALHNMTQENLRQADELGGMPMPSVAVVPGTQGHRHYGDVTLIAPREMIEGEPVFDSDAYTQRIVRPEYRKARSAVAQEVVDSFRPFASKFGDEYTLSEVWDNAVNRARPEDTIRRLESADPSVIAWFLNERYGTDLEPVMRPYQAEVPFAEMPSFRQYVEHGGNVNPAYGSEEHDALTAAVKLAINEYVDQVGGDLSPEDRQTLRESWEKRWISDEGRVAFGYTPRIERTVQGHGTEEIDMEKTRERARAALRGKEAEFQQWAQDKILGMHGEPYVQLGRRRVPYTLDNIIEKMRRERRLQGAEATLTFGEGMARAVAATRVNSVEEMRNRARSQIRPETEIEAARAHAKELLEEYRNDALKYYGEPTARGEFGHTWEGLDASMRAIVYWARNRLRRGGPSAMRAGLRREGFRDVPDYLIDEAIEAGKAFMDAPVPYFEAKPQRAVSIGEFSGAVIPEDASRETRDILERNGVPYETYSTEGDRELARENAVVEFRRRLSEQGHGVLFHRREPVTETPAFRQWFGDSKVVDENGAPLRVYHGTLEDFSVFDPTAAKDKTLGGYALQMEGVNASFFTDSGDVASSFATAHQGGRVMPVYLNIRNPLEINAEGRGWNRYLTAIREAGQGDKHDGVILRNVRDYMTTPGREEPETRTSTVYVTFNPTQVKSAIGNRGTFSPESPSIVEHRTGEKPATSLEAFDVRDGLGAVPNNQEVAYRGFAVEIPASQFLELAAGIPSREESVAHLKSTVEQGGKLGVPFLNARWNAEARRWEVTGHEGRHRARAIQEIYGSDAAIPVHIFPGDGMRARDVTPEMRSAPFVDESAAKLARYEDSADYVSGREQRLREVQKKRPRSPVAARKPTEAQARAGNYKKGRQRVQGLPIAIETPAGRYREGTDESGKPWRHKMVDHYGYINLTRGADGEHVDVFTKKGLGAYVEPGHENAATAYVVNQMTPNGERFDEHKVLLGPESVAEARRMYLRNFERGWRGLGEIHEMPVEVLREWLSKPRRGPITQAQIDEAARRAGIELPGQAKREATRHARDIRDALRQRLRLVPSSPRTFVVANRQELPRHLRDYLATVSRPEDVTGMFDPLPGQASIYLIADGIKNADEATEVWVHEVVGHYGLRGVLGARYGEIMDEVARAFPEQVRRRARQHGFTWNDVNQRRAAAEEFVAYTSQKVLNGKKAVTREQTLLTRIMDILRNALRHLGVRTKWTDRQLMSLIQDAANYVWSPQGRASEQATLREGFRRHERPPTYYSQLYRSMTDPKVPESAPITEYVNIIKAKVRKNEIKEAEVEWTGILDALDAIAHPEKVSTLGQVSTQVLLDNREILPKRLQDAIEVAEIVLAEEHLGKNVLSGDPASIARSAYSEGLGRGTYSYEGEKKMPKFYAAWAEIGRLARELDTSKLRVTRDFILDAIRGHEVEVEVRQPTTESDGDRAVFVDFRYEDGVFVDPSDEYIEEDASGRWSDTEYEARVDKALENELDEWVKDDGTPINSVEDIPPEGVDAARARVRESYMDELHREALESAYEFRPLSWVDGPYEIQEEDPSNFFGMQGKFNVSHEGQWIGSTKPGGDLHDAIDIADAHYIKTHGMPETTIWEQHTLPGGENYRERLFIWRGQGGNQGVSVGKMGIHYPDDTDFLVHARLDERQTADGKRAIFVDEIQSDWHQFNRDQQKEWGVMERRAERARERVSRLRRDYEDAIDAWKESVIRLAAEKGSPAESLVRLALIRPLLNWVSSTEELAHSSVRSILEKGSVDYAEEITDSLANLLSPGPRQTLNVLAALEFSPTFRKAFASISARAPEEAVNGMKSVIMGKAVPRAEPRYQEKLLSLSTALGIYGPMTGGTRSHEWLMQDWDKYLDVAVMPDSLTEGSFIAAKARLMERVNDEISPWQDLWNKVRGHRMDVRAARLDVNETESIIREAEHGPSVVPAPFENDYMVLTTKWFVQEAVRQGHDTILFAPGTVHGTRWMSTKSISSLEFRPFNPETWPNLEENNFIALTGESVTPENGDEFVILYPPDMGRFDVVNKKKLRYVIGSRAAASVLEKVDKVSDNGPRGRINEQTGDTDIWYPSHPSDEDRLKIHMGSLAIYDEIYVNKINKWLKKYKARLVPGAMQFSDFNAERYGLEKTGIDRGYGQGSGQVRVMRLDITPKLREAAENDGFPLFHRRDLTDIREHRQAAMVGNSWDLDEGSRTSRLWNSLVFSAQDKFEGLFRIQKAIESSFGKLPESVNAYLKEEMYPSRVKYRVDKFDRDYVQPLVEMIRKSGYSWDDVEDYLYARHAPEANVQLAKINEDARYNSGMTDDEAADVMSRLRADGDFSKLEAIGAHVDAMTKFHRETLVRDGLEEQEEIDAWEATYQYYVPLRGLGANSDAANLLPIRGRGYDVGGPSVKRRLGRTTRATSILANIVAQQQATFIRAEKARVGRAVLGLAQQYPNRRLWSVNELKLNRYLDRRTGLVARRIDPMYKLANNVMRVRVDGKDQVVTFNEDNETARRTVRALNNLDAREMGRIVQALHRLNRLLSALNTSFNPQFTISNFMRDIQTAFVNLNATEIGKMKRRVMRNVFPAMRGIYRSMFRGDVDQEWARQFDDYRRVGGQVGWLDNYRDVEDLDKKLRNRLRDMDSRFVSWTTVRQFFETVEKANMVIENGVRLAAFAEARKVVGDERAASIAKNLTVNFNRKGDIGAAANAMYLFYNASVQGGAVIWNVAKSPAARKYMYGIVAGAAIMDIAMRMMGGQDDDGEWRYDKIEESVKERNLIIMLPPSMQPDQSESLDDYYIKIPLPYGYNVFHTVGRKLGGYLDRALVGNKRQVNPVQDSMEILLSALHSFNPIGTEATVAQTLSPTISDPIVQIAENKAWYGGPIVPEEDPYEIAPKPMSERYFRTVSEGSKIIARALNRLGGGTETTPSQIPALDVSPEVIDHLIDFFTGGAGRFVTNMTEVAQMLAGMKEFEIDRAPFLNRLVGKTSSYQIRDAYYEHLKWIEYADRELDAALANGNNQRVNQLWRDYGAELRMRGQARAAQRFLRGQRQQRRRFEENESLRDEDRKQRVEDLEDQMDRRMNDFNKQYNQQTRPNVRRDREISLLDGAEASPGDAALFLRREGLLEASDLVANLPAAISEKIAEGMTS